MVTRPVSGKKNARFLTLCLLCISLSQQALEWIHRPNVLNRNGFRGYGGFFYESLPLPFSISAVSFPALQSIISQSVAPNEQGELQGSPVALGSISAILAPFLFSSIFIAFSDQSKIYVPGAAYYDAAGICVIALFIAMMSNKTRIPGVEA